MSDFSAIFKELDQLESGTNLKFVELKNHVKDSIFVEKKIDVCFRYKVYKCRYFY